MPIAQLLLSRTVLAQIAAILFALLAHLGVVLPATMNPTALVSAVLLILTAATAIARFHIGDDGDAKAWWQSKVIWTNVVGAAVAVLALFGAGSSLDPAGLVETIMIVVAVLNVWLRSRTTAAIG